ncbi:ABC transporter ATP-binding protein/permease [Candidatus Saccharibacteria bacterium]|nr:ABC transporter ATP-binding protein/permease [Candidatus Saccharibacteria bacterium]
MTKNTSKLPNVSRISEILRFHWKYAMRHPKLVATSFTVGPASIVAERYLAPILIASLLNDIQQGAASLSASLWIIIGYALLQLVAFVIGYRINLYAMWSLQIAGARDIYKDSYEVVSRHSMRFPYDRFAGSLVSQITKTSNAFMSFWNMVVFDIMFVVVSILATLIGVSFIAPWLAIALFVFVIIFGVTAFYGNRFLRPRQKKRSESYSAISAQLSDSITNMFTVKTESKEAFETQTSRQRTRHHARGQGNVRNGIMTTTSITAGVTAFARIAALVFSIWAVQQGMANAAEVYLLLTFAFNLIGEMWNINSSIRTVYQIVGDSEEMFDIMNTPLDIKDKAHKTLKITEGSLALESIAFAHKNGAAVFEKLSLSIPAGQHVGIVGRSGAGKTTLTKLLLRLAEPDSGEILIDGQNIHTVSQKSLHKAIAYVPQEPLLFHRTLRENISYGNPKASLEEIKQAAQKANALEFIEKLPEGFDTLVGERGVKLSGGQRQRIAIARAILKDAPILILDEATSALDSESEKLIQDALQTLMKDRTSIVIAHRLSTIAKLDRILVMNEGAVVEDGTHAELIGQQGIYAQLWAHQSGGFIEE